MNINSLENLESALNNPFRLIARAAVKGKTKINLLVSPEDQDLLQRATWRISPRGYVDTAIVYKDVEHKMYLHQMVCLRKFGRRANYPQEMIDHINRDKTDNRRENLRFVSPSENVRNSKKRKRLVQVRRNKDEGVSFHKKTNRWSASAGRWGVYITLGTLKTREEALALRHAFNDALEALSPTWEPSKDRRTILIVRNMARRSVGLKPL